ncbi:haloacid dehalogenase-like hydrolase [Frigoriglobus tundricola]|nr:haloacid dehalogenase-like hydrolase [Frigoriglobus tundricola]
MEVSAEKLQYNAGMPIILFDIDGTLVRSGGAGKAAMEAALVAAFGVAELRDEVPYSGRTDTAITRDLLRVHGIDATPANQQTLRDAYLAQLPGSLALKGGTVCPGVPELLAAVAGAPGVVLGLLTGNVRTGARTKLAHFGLWDFFACGGFGDDHFDRDDVARSALASVHAHVGRAVDPADVWVIGDTPLDVSCARAIGANAVAVATGWHTMDELAGHKPDLIFDDLSDHSRLLTAWGR